MLLLFFSKCSECCLLLLSTDYVFIFQIAFWFILLIISNTSRLHPILGHRDLSSITHSGWCSFLFWPKGCNAQTLYKEVSIISPSKTDTLYQWFAQLFLHCLRLPFSKNWTWEMQRRRGMNEWRLCATLC